MKDLFGKALLDYCNNNYTEDIITWTNISSEDILPIPYLFRSFSEMPHIEQSALNMANGKILDVGCGAGSHCLYLQEKGLSVKGIDISKGAVATSLKRGVLNVEQKSVLDESETFDTILLLMNGTGIFQTLDEVVSYLEHIRSILNPGGQILIDSSDIQYMYEDEDGGIWVDANSNYYGELDYYLSYKGEDEVPIKWLYLDFDRLNSACQNVHLNCEKIEDGDHFDYLARLTVASH